MQHQQWRRSLHQGHGAEAPDGIDSFSLQPVVDLLRSPLLDGPPRLEQGFFVVVGLAAGGTASVRSCVVTPWEGEEDGQWLRKGKEGGERRREGRRKEQRRRCRGEEEDGRRRRRGEEEGGRRRRRGEEEVGLREGRTERGAPCACAGGGG